ncbi:hypothetical protein COCOR_04107 [Corallococcus coralloides DSM 2259]|uniref:DUF676 domain-containing protein n=1 Tax=Corallococcus coralloides (strain ATCC 25202 / DSM 2259 / NBRC 100086 / M2) TaxID=1144275 RepID=H8MXA0_CORCM|nr:hypothetical protein [Corallococcus coralloides]AFE05634.1 hypothetical protein COCOR_04107 [Corallococcus coralloides DSM 2259]
MSTIDRTRSLAVPSSTSKTAAEPLAKKPVAHQPAFQKSSFEQSSAQKNSLLGGFIDAAVGGIKDIPRFVEMGANVFNATTVKEITSLFGGAKPDRAQDGMFVGAGGKVLPATTKLGDVPGITPKNNPNPDKTILYVNGIMTPTAGQVNEMQALANSSGAKVVGIHNATEGLVKDLGQCVTDKLDKGKNPAVDTLADTLYSELKAGRDVHLVGYSQGGLITARALNDVAKRLRVEDGLSPAQVEAKLSHLQVETFGAASTKYPDGPQYVHYVNNADPVPTLTGLGGDVDPLAFLKDAGKGAVVHRFTDGNLNPLSNHMLDTLYLKHRVDFDQARQNQF